MSTPREPKQVFQEARELPKVERAAFLDGACGGDAALRARVEALLAAEEEAGAFLAAPTQGAVDPNDHPPSERPSAVIDRFKLLQQIGEGGFGTVWMAEQQQPVRRNVALKIVKRGMDTRSVVARFEQERQALAMMDHPNIAKVFDGGETPAGRPYFAMELVRGLPLTQFCDDQHLDTGERLRLFVHVCHAVQHAHQKGIIHRDLKPSNVLVTLHDGVPVPKVIDFGIAKAVHRPLTEKTLFTEFRQMVGTPEYMSPEQAELSGLDIDTRADIYALGVLLYELLTGTLPFDSRTLEQKGLLELLRVIREDEPPKPSTRISTPGQPGTEAAKRRRTDPRRLGRLLRGDLDWIVMKTLEKDRARRYVSADALAADIERHLRDEPVQASPPGRIYKLRKYVRRHRVGVGAGAAVAMALVAGLSAAVFGLLTAREQRDVARTESGRANVVLGLLKDALSSADPHPNKGKDYRVRDLLDEFERLQASHLQGEPEVAVTVHDLLGTAYLGLGLLDKAKPHVDKTLELRRQLLGPEHELVARAMIKQAQWLHDSGRFAEAVPVMQGAQRILIVTAGIGARGVDATYVCLANYYRQLDQPQLAEATMRDALTALDRVLVSRTARAHLLVSAATVFADNGRHAEAEDLLRPVLDLSPNARELVPGTEQALAGYATNWEGIGLRTLAQIVRRFGRLEQAKRLQKRSLEIARATYEPPHHEIARELQCFGGILAAEGEHAEAKNAFAEAADQAEQALGEGHDLTVILKCEVARCHSTLREWSEAEALLNETIATIQKRSDPECSILAAAFGFRAHVFDKVGRLDEAEGDYLESLDIFQRLGRLGLRQESHALGCVEGLTALYHRLGRHADAEALIRQTYYLLRETFGANDSRSLRFERFLAYRLFQQGRLREAEQLLLDVCEAARVNPGEASLARDECMAILAEVLMKQGKHEEAVRVACDAASSSSPRRIPDSNDRAILLNNLAQLLQRQGQFIDAGRIQVEALEMFKRVEGKDSLKASQGSANLAVIRNNEGNPAEAERLLLEAIPRMEAHLSAQDPVVLGHVRNLAITSVHLQKWTQAADSLRKVLAAHSRDDDGDMVVSSRAMLIHALRHLDAHAEIEPLATDALESARRCHPSGSIEVANALAQLALTKLDLERPSEAEPLARECLAIRDQLLPGSVQHCNAMSLHGDSLVGLGRFAEAEPLLQEGYERMPADASIALFKRQALDRLIQCYEAWGKADEAARWRKLLEAEPGASK